MPFRFGAVTVTHGLQAFVRVRVRLDDGREGLGYAAEALGAKWFDKNPALTDEQNVDQLRKSIEIASRCLPCGAADDAVRSLRGTLHGAAERRRRASSCCRSSRATGRRCSIAPFSTRVCRLTGLSFWRAMRSNIAGHPRTRNRARPGRLRLRRIPRQPRAVADASRRAIRSASSTRSSPATRLPAPASATACPRRSKK